MAMGSIAVYGGSFDPFGNHHKKAVDHLKENFDTVLIVPSTLHAIKSNQTPWIHRFNMCSLGAEDMPKAIVSMHELDYIRTNPGPVYTIDLLRHMKNQLGILMELRFAIGPDTTKEFKKWKNTAEIEKEFGFYELPEMDGFHSSEIRDMVKKNNDAWRGMVPKGVEKYIEIHNIYKEQNEQQLCNQE